MVRSYSRHGPVEAFGIIASNTSNSIFDGKLCWTPAAEDVLCWNMKKGELLAMWHGQGQTSEVTCIARAEEQKDVFAVGYQDGSIRLWSAYNKSVIVTFNGHRKAVTSLAFDKAGTRLASGSQDTDIIIWDIVAETGMFRLRGHRDQITSLAFVAAPPTSVNAVSESTAEEATETEAAASTSTAPISSLSSHAQNHLISCSKDTLLKLWDLPTQHCVSTIVAHRTQIWTLATFIDPSTNSVVVLTGGGEGEAKAWTINSDILNGKKAPTNIDASEGPFRAITPLVEGLLPLATLSHSQRIAQISFHPSENLLAVQTTERTVEVLRLRTEEEIRKKIARRRKREKEKRKEKALKAGKSIDNEEEAGASSSVQEPTWKDRLASWITIRAPGKIRSFHFGIGANKLKEVTIMTALSNNAVEVYSLPPQPTKASKKEAAGADGEDGSDRSEASRLYALELPGHRTDIRTLCLSSDDALLASGANGTLKVWNVKTTKCLRTMECGYAICSAFLPGDRHIVVGTKSGELMLYDVGSSTLLETFKAHQGEVWGISVRPDGKGLVSGSADKDIKFWDFEIKDVVINADEKGAPPAYRKTLSMTHTRTLKMTDDVLAVKYSPNGKFLAVSLLDSTVKVFYADSLKFSLSLYGHKLPVLAMDISSDSKLIVTCSADKNVKIWGMDFGDCHRSLFAHDDSIMQVQFEHGSHYFWTVGKDKMVKYWDGDKFECIQKLDGHHGEVWALAVSHQGNFVATAAHDKSIRIWEKLDEPLFLEEEREKELEAIYDANVERDRERDELRATRDGGDATGPEATAVEKTTTQTLMAGEKIIEALEISEEDRSAANEYEAARAAMTAEARDKMAPRQRNAVFSIYDSYVEPEVHVLKVVQKIPPASLNDALLVLPFSKVISMLQHLDYWAQHRLNISLTSRVLFFLLKTHYSQIVATRLMKTTIIDLREHLRTALSEQKETIGYNLAALRQLQRQRTTHKVNDFFDKEGFGNEEEVRAKIAEGQKKRKRAAIKA